MAQTRKPKVRIAHQVLICPVGDTDLVRETESEFEFFTGPFLDVPFMRKVVDLYLPNTKDRKNPLASPVRMTKAEAAEQPPTTLIVSSVDPLRSDGLKLGGILQAAGVDTVIVRGEGLIHDAFMLEATRQDPTCVAIVGLITNRLKAAFAPATATPSKSATVAPTKRSAATDGTRKKRTKRS